jgi:hypothetical protein
MILKFHLPNDLDPALLLLLLLPSVTSVGANTNSEEWDRRFPSFLRATLYIDVAVARFVLL